MAAFSFSERIIVAHPRLARRFSGRVKAWVYADDMQRHFEAIELAMGKASALVTPAQLQAEAVRLLPEFIQWADEQIPLGDVAEWLLTPCHRNPFSSNLFLHLVCLSIVDRYGGDGPVVVFTEASGLAKTLRQLCRAQNWGFSWHGQPRFHLHSWKTNIRACAKLGYDVLRSLTGILAARFFLGAKQFGRLADVELLIDTYLDPDSLANDGTYHDKQLPGLLDWYRAQGVRAAIYPFPVHFSLRQLPELFRRMQVSRVPVLPFELLTRLTDIPKSAAVCLEYALRDMNCSHFENFDVSPLVEGERFKACTAGLLPLLLLIAPSRLAANGIRPNTLLDWFENQPIDRANAIGFGRAGCRVVALRLYALYPMFASLFTSERQVRAGTCPPLALVGGAAMEKQLTRNDHHTRYRRVPALRYGHVHNARRHDEEGDALLLLLTHSREESLAILSCVLPVLRDVPECFPKVLIKPHGDFGGDRLRREVASRWPWAVSMSRIEWTSQRVEDLVCEARIMISAGSSAALEAICRGVPVIVIGRQAGLNMNPLLDVDGRLWTMAYDASDVGRAIDAWSPRHPLSLAERVATGEAIRAEYFEVVDEQAMKAFADVLTY